MNENISCGIIQQFLNDPDVSEIMVNGRNRIFIEKNGKKFLTDVSFSSEDEVLALAQKIFSTSGKRIGADIPYADVCLADGTRVNAIVYPLSRFGISLTLRKFSKNIQSIKDLIANNTLSERAAELLVACIKGKINMILSGGTGVGKTTTLQILSQYFGDEERIITIEDAAELKIDRQNVISLETRTADENGRGAVTIRDLIRNALRMAPDRLVIGEVRGEEAIDMLQAMATGHSGTIGIIHGNSPKDVLARLETMVLMSGVNLPLWEVRKLIASTINLIVHVERLRDGSRKVTHITEVRGLEREEIVLNDLFLFKPEKTSEQGVIHGALVPSIKYYPLFFQSFQKQKLLSDKVFVNEQ